MPQSAQNLLAGWLSRDSNLSLALDGSASVKALEVIIGRPHHNTDKANSTSKCRYIYSDVSLAIRARNEINEDGN